jgi:DNA polymerase III subunit delta'
MQAFLLLGEENLYRREKISEMSKTLSAKIIFNPIIKTEDIKSLNKLLRLSFSEPTVFVCENIQNATPEAMNAFLKNLEEPQPNVYFILTANSLKSVLPTISSRCQIIRIKTEEHVIINNDRVIEFFNSNSGKKFQIIDKLKLRDDAIEFLNDLIYYTSGVHNFQFSDIFLKTLKNIKMNGNISLQLTNLIVKMEFAQI